MRVVFMGFQTWGHITLKAILASRHVVPLVITHPGSNQAYEKIWNDSVKDLALAHEIPVVERQYANDEEIATIVRAAEPDIIVSSDWRTWLCPEIYTIPKFGSINIHDALLPRYGGFAPINWAIINGETETGVTVHFMNDEFDLGDIMLQEKVPISLNDTATDIFYRTLELFPKMTLEALDLIECGQVNRIQQDRTRATFYHKRNERDSLIDWTQSRLHIYNLIRAQTDPYPNAYTFHNGRKLKIKKAHLPEQSYGGMPGRVFCRTQAGVVVVCGTPPASSAGLVVEVVQAEGADAVLATHYFKHMGDYLGG